jgi:hypothetical protein
MRLEPRSDGGADSLRPQGLGWHETSFMAWKGPVEPMVN